jgi:hypothetical protein
LKDILRKGIYGKISSYQLKWEKKHIFHDVVAYIPFINGIFKQSNMKEEHIYFMEMINKCISPNKFTYNSLVDGHCKEGNLAFTLKI